MWGRRDRTSIPHYWSKWLRNTSKGNQRHVNSSYLEGYCMFLYRRTFGGERPSVRGWVAYKLAGLIRRWLTVKDGRHLSQNGRGKILAPDLRKQHNNLIYSACWGGGGLTRDETESRTCLARQILRRRRREGKTNTIIAVQPTTSRIISNHNMCE